MAVPGQIGPFCAPEWARFGSLAEAGLGDRMLGAGKAGCPLVRVTGAAQAVEAAVRSGVRVRAGIAAADSELEPTEVELPALMVMIALPVVGEIMVTQDDAGAVLLGVQGDDNARGPGRDLSLIHI